MSTKVWIGLDNGVSGALAFLSDDGVRTHLMPGIKTGKRTLIDVQRLKMLLSEVEGIACIYIEKTKLNPAFGAKGNHGSGISAGRVTATLDLMQVPYVEIEPKAWQKAIGIATAPDKKLAVMHWVRMRFPGIGAEAWKRGDGRADALALAWYCRQKEGLPVSS